MAGHHLICCSTPCCTEGLPASQAPLSRELYHDSAFLPAFDRHRKVPTSHVPAFSSHPVGQNFGQCSFW